MNITDLLRRHLYLSYRSIDAIDTKIEQVSTEICRSNYRHHGVLLLAFYEPCVWVKLPQSFSHSYSAIPLIHDSKCSFPNSHVASQLYSTRALPLTLDVNFDLKIRTYLPFHHRLMTQNLYFKFHTCTVDTIQLVIESTASTNFF